MVVVDRYSARAIAHRVVDGSSLWHIDKSTDTTARANCPGSYFEVHISSPCLLPTVAISYLPTDRPATHSITMPARYAAIDSAVLLGGRADEIRIGYASREANNCTSGKDCGGTVSPYHACCPEDTKCVSLDLNARVCIFLLGALGGLAGVMAMAMVMVICLVMVWMCMMRICADRLLSIVLQNQQRLLVESHRNLRAVCERGARYVLQRRLLLLRARAEGIHGLKNRGRWVW